MAPLITSKLCTNIKKKNYNCRKIDLVFVGLSKSPGKIMWIGQVLAARTLSLVSHRISSGDLNRFYTAV